MLVSVCYYVMDMQTSDRDRLSRIRQSLHELAKEIEQLIPVFAERHPLVKGTVYEQRRKCGKPTCHCASGEGHSAWSLTFMANGKKRVERIPKEWVEEVRRRVGAGREFQDAVREVLTANAELLVLRRKQKAR